MAQTKAPRNQQPLDPESESWNKLPWRKLEQHVYRIQKRIFKAEQRGNTRAVYKLQKLLMKSENSTVTPKCNEHEETKKTLENSEIFQANSEKSKCSFSTLIQLFHGYSFDNILTEANKDWLILEQIIEVASTAVGSLVGACILTLLLNVLFFAGINPQLQEFFQGLFLILAVVASTLVRRFLQSER